MNFCQKTQKFSQTQKNTPLIREYLIERKSFFQSFSTFPQNPLKFKEIMELQCYGYLFGKIKLIKDNHHDEVFIEKTSMVIIENNHWLLSFNELVAIANELLRDDD